MIEFLFKVGFLVGLCCLFGWLLGSAKEKWNWDDTDWFFRFPFFVLVGVGLFLWISKQT
jgi:hypothetical protein